MDIIKIAEHDVSADIEALALISNDIIGCVKRHRTILGERSGLLDKFILGVLKLLNNSGAFDYTSGAFDDINSELRGLCVAVRDGKNYSKHPFYPFLKAFINDNPCPAPEIYVDYYCAAVSLQYSEYALNKYIEKRKQSLTAILEEAQITELAAELEKFIPSSDLEELCSLMFKRLVITPASNVFLQSAADQLILSYLLEDNTSRYVFQHLLDSACVSNKYKRPSLKS